MTTDLIPLEFESSELLAEIEGIFDALQATIPPDEAHAQGLTSELQTSLALVMDGFNRLKDGLLKVREQRNHLFDELATLEAHFSQGAEGILKQQQRSLSELLQQQGLADGPLGLLIKDVNAIATKRLMEKIEDAKEIPQ